LFVLFCAASWFALWLALTIGRINTHRHLDSTVEVIAIKEGVQKTAVERYFSKLETIGNTSLTLIGVLWAFLFLSEKNNVSLDSAPKVMLVFMPHLFLLASYLCYFFGDDFLTARMFYKETFDPGSAAVEFWRRSQIYYFLGGALCLANTIVAVRKRNQPS